MVLEDTPHGSGLGVSDMIFMNVFWVLILVGGFILLVKSLTTRPEAGHQLNALLKGRNSIDILKERYARGKIDREEFERIKRDLTEA